MITDLILLRSTGLSHFIDEYLNIVGNKFINSIFNSLMDIVDEVYPFIESK
jgi:hypothetical protein